jgi:predicted NBD/HSP70 family sugar kinase
MTGLSKPTISSLAEDLINDRYISDNGMDKSKKQAGRKPNALVVNEAVHFAIVIHLEHATALGKLISITGKTIDTYEVRETGPAFDYFQASLSIIQKFKEHENVIFDFLCFIIPAMIDPRRETIFSTILWEGNDEGDKLYSQIKSLSENIPTAIFNDTACISYAEKFYTKLKDQNFVYILFEKGIGASITIDGSLVGKGNGAYTQFGHISVDAQGEPCSCGNRGCLENAIGEKAIYKVYNSFTTGKKIASLSFKELRARADHGDRAAGETIHRIKDILAQILRNLIALFAPTQIILGGTIEDLGYEFLDSLKESVKKQSLQLMAMHTEIKYAYLKKDQMEKGAVRFFYDKYFTFNPEENEKFYVG